ncbi:uncharacterized protein LOC126570998 [Anopheles aquasalis]|uniref:uncharacterized protein LOC126570998 n=1 Tax=Anopheles aquasalis TaxID=42839 RepID=UPI00215B0C8C|nr:uncharacterized protein LOC126570998 [Anopheles aquasalis]
MDVMDANLCLDLDNIVRNICISGRFQEIPEFSNLVSSDFRARVRPFNTTRVGYLGDHFLLELICNPRPHCNEHIPELFFQVPGMVTPLFLKTTPTKIPTLQQYLQSIGTASKEASMYQELLPKMEEFSRFAPRCYYVETKANYTLVLENLQTQGFTSIASDSMGIFDRQHLECALVAMAKFHSASLLLEAKTGQSLPQLAPGVLDENAWKRTENNPRVEELNNAIKVLLELVKVTERDNPELPFILDRLPPFVEQIYELVKPSTEYKNVACHGDLWASNLMFRYDDGDTVRQPVECLIIDFQFARYTPPAYDVNMLITLTTTGEFRQQHYSELINFYFNRLEEELAKHDGHNLLPKKEEFLASCTKYRTSALIENFLMNHVTLLPRSKVDHIFSSTECYEAFSGKAKIDMCLEVLRDNAPYRDRITGIIRDLIAAL